MNEKGRDSGGREDIHGAPEYRVRRDDVTAWRTTFLVLAGCIGMLTFFYTVISGFNSSLNIAVQNERVERINSDNRIEGRINECCSRRGW